MGTLTVVCVKWGQKYGAEWVTKLRNMVAQNLETEHTFTCITDKPVEDIDCIPLVCDLPGWWQKIGMFQPGLFRGPVLYFDLDVVITADLSPFMRCYAREPSKLWALDDFSYSLREPRKDIDPHTRRLLGGDGTINSSVMMWSADIAADVWRNFRRDKMRELHGDQNWITQALWPAHVNLFPDGLANSYKYHIARGTAPAPVVVFHGEPKVVDLSPFNALREIWEAAA